MAATTASNHPPPLPCFPKYPAHRKFPISELPASLRGPVNFQPRKRLSPSIFTSLYELRFNTRRYYARSVCVYIYMESWWEEYKKKVTTSIMGVHRMGEKTCGGRERERERNGGVKILKRVSWINSRECTRAKSHRSFPRPPYFPRATSRWIRNRCACSKMYRRPLLVENVKRGRLSKFLFFQNWW